MAAELSDEDLYRDFGRSLTAEIAPAESPFYDEIIEAYSRPQPTRKDRSLAFGTSPNDIILSVALLEIGKVALQGIWTAAQPILIGVAQDTANDMRKSLSEKIAKWIKSRFTTPSPIELDPDAIQQIVKTVQKTAVAQGLNEKQVVQITQTIFQAISGP